jgi:hypothetical protein
LPTCPRHDGPNVTDRIIGRGFASSKCGRPAPYSLDARLVGHLNQVSIIPGLIACCGCLWLPSADPGGCRGCRGRRRPGSSASVAVPGHGIGRRRETRLSG